MNFQLHETQKPIALDLHRFRVLCCGRRWGKTTLAIDQMKGRAAIPNSRVAYVAPTFQQARDIAWNELKRDCLQAAETINESRLEIKLVNGSLIALRGWEAIETLRGQKFDLVVIDEVAMMRDFWEKWQEVIRPTLTDNKGEAIFISTPKGFNHFYDLYNLENDPKINEHDEWKSFHYTTYDNPHIPKEEVDAARNSVTDDRFAQEYLADFRKTEGLVYKEFDREIHLISEADFDEDEWNVIETIGGIDPGFRHRAVALTIKKTASGRYIVSDEWSKTGKTDAEIAEYVSKLEWNRCYPDPENQGCIAELERRGVNVREVVKGRGSVLMGINVVRELFKNRKLFIVKERCPNLILGLETYTYDSEKRSDPRNDENPLKENDDEVDALRYPLMMDADDEEGEVNQYRPQWISRRN